MTDILLDVYVDTPHPAPSTTLATGTLTFAPTARRTDPPTGVILPAGFSVAVPTTTIHLDPTPDTGEWAWKVIEKVKGLKNVTRYVTVPDSPDPTNYSDLPEVNPDTLLPYDTYPTIAQEIAALWDAIDALTPPPEPDPDPDPEPGDE